MFVILFCTPGMFSGTLLANCSHFFVCNNTQINRHHIVPLYVSVVVCLSCVCSDLCVTVYFSEVVWMANSLFGSSFISYFICWSVPVLFINSTDKDVFTRVQLMVGWSVCLFVTRREQQLNGFLRNSVDRWGLPRKKPFSTDVELESGDSADLLIQFTSFISVRGILSGISHYLRFVDCLCLLFKFWVNLIVSGETSFLGKLNSYSQTQSDRIKIYSGLYGVM